MIKSQIFKTHKCDVLIAGAGPAGLASCFFLADKNLKIAIIDKHSETRYKLCAGGLTLKSINELKRIFNINLSELIKNNIVSKKNSYLITYKDKLIKKGRARINYYISDRQKFDLYLLDKIRNFSNVQCFFDKKIINIKKDYAVLSNNDRIYFKYCINTTGVLGLFNFNKKRDNQIKTFSSDFKVNRKINEIHFHYDNLNKGYGWCFPRENSINIGVGGINSEKEILNIFYVLKKRYEKYIISEYNQGFFYVNNNLKLNLIQNNKIINAGDSCGISGALFGEGIYYAFLTGYLAGLSINKSLETNKNFVKIYKTEIKKILPEFYAEKLLSEMFNKLLYFCPVYVLKFFMSNYSNIIFDCAHGKRNFFMFKKKDCEFD